LAHDALGQAERFFERCDLVEVLGAAVGLIKNMEVFLM
jgi:hypothetical protein